MMARIISAKDDFIRKVIEERMKVKKSDRKDKDQIQLILKIIANATSYSIYIEENQKSLDKEEDVNVYSVDNFSFRTRKIEKQGQYFNPIMATLITGSARLILAMAEHIAEDKGYFCNRRSRIVQNRRCKSDPPHINYHPSLSLPPHCWQRVLSPVLKPV
jgi:hypothetical protein